MKIKTQLRRNCISGSQHRCTTDLAEELIGDGLIADAVGHQRSLEEQPQRQLRQVLDQSIDGLETELEYLLTLHQPAVILHTRETEGNG